MAHENKLEVLRNLGNRAKTKRTLHVKASAYYEKWNSIIEMSVIILATIAGLTSFSTVSIEQNLIVQLGVGIINFIITIFGSIQRYYTMSEKQFLHHYMSVQFSSLSKTVNIEIMILENKPDQVDDFLRKITDEYNKLTETAPMVPENIIKAYEAQTNCATITTPRIAISQSPLAQSPLAQPQHTLNVPQTPITRASLADVMPYDSTETIKTNASGPVTNSAIYTAKSSMPNTRTGAILSINTTLTPNRQPYILAPALNPISPSNVTVQDTQRQPAILNINSKTNTQIGDNKFNGLIGLNRTTKQV